MSRNLIRGVLTTLLLASLSGSAGAGVPEYMTVAPRIGLGVEVEGEMTRGGFLTAADFELLAKPRAPKLRGEVTDVGSDGTWIVMFGQRIAVTSDTEFKVGGPGDLRAGRRLEVKVKVRDGAWFARTIEGGDIKDSNKVKATITDMSLDGVAPDTLYLEGLPVLLDEHTGVPDALLRRDNRQADLYGRLGLPDARRLRHGHTSRDGRFGMRLQYRQQLSDKQEFDLTKATVTDIRTTRPEFKFRSYAFLNEDLRALLEMRLRRRYVLSSDLGSGHEDAEFILRQAYVLWRGIAGQDLGLAVGRQKIKETRQWLWDEYLEAARLTWYGPEKFDAEILWIDPVKTLKEKFATWQDLYVAVGFRPTDADLVTVYMLRRQDSDEVRNREPVWWGLRYLGKPLRKSVAWFDLAVMRGTDKHEDLRAWALDLGANWRIPGLPWRTSVTAGYAIGSGDEHDSPDHSGEFRQTGYEDNTIRLGGLTGVRYYGAVLDPELSNLAVATFGVGLRPGDRVSCEVLYHRYRQDWSEDDLRGSLVDPPARPNGVSADIGWGVDAVFSTRNILGRVKAAWTIGIFEPGEAYAPRQERALFNKINISVEI